jgi:hypothetical protein
VNIVDKALNNALFLLGLDLLNVNKALLLGLLVTTEFNDFEFTASHVLLQAKKGLGLLFKDLFEFEKLLFEVFNLLLFGLERGLHLLSTMS